VLDHAAPPNAPDESPPEDQVVSRSVPIGVVAAVAGLIVGLGVVAVLALTGAFDVERREPDAQDQLVAAFERHRAAVYAFDGEFTRTMPDGRRLESGAFVVQRPPDELRRQLGGTSGRINGRRVNCSVGPDDRFQCATGAPVDSWDAMVARELDNLRSYFDPAAPAYTADRVSGGCFELQLVAAVPDPPYGVRAELCFDEPTGALRRVEIEHEGGAVDRLEAVAIRTTVTNDDFGLDGQEQFEARQSEAD
jgi:hypothetical protein